MFTTRTGITGYCTPYDAQGVKMLSGGRIRLTATKTRSAGLMGPQIDVPCRIECEVTGKLHALHPLAVFSVWIYDDVTRNELDLVETARWGAAIGPGIGDQNNPKLYKLTSWLGRGVGSEETHVNWFDARAYTRHKIVAELGADGWATVRVYGWWQGDRWNEIAWLHAPWYPGQLRVALWTFPGIADALGECTVTVDRVTVTAVAESAP
jgi:hypothetical protein